MAYVAPINQNASTLASQAPPTVIVVTQSVKCPMGTSTSVGAPGGTRAYPFVS